MTDEKKPDFSNYTKFLRGQFQDGGLARLEEIAENAKLSKYELYRIAIGHEQITEEIALALALVTEPKSDQWMLDPEHALDPVPDLTDAQIVERLQYAQDNGKLDVIAHVSGVKGGAETLHDIIHKGPNIKLDRITRMLLLNVME